MMKTQGNLTRIASTKQLSLFGWPDETALTTDGDTNCGAEETEEEMARAKLTELERAEMNLVLVADYYYHHLKVYYSRASSWM
jgi:hypothetical protein